MMDCRVEPGNDRRALISQTKGRDMSSDDTLPDGGKMKPMREALDGDLGAIKEIFDRMDGKAVPGTVPEEPPGQVVFQWKDPA
jgi:hypothetical protein